MSISYGVFVWLSVLASCLKKIHEFSALGRVN
jgi:hypothetical protein